MSVHEKLLVSIIIPTYNEEKNIERLLHSIAVQNYKNVETIIVDQTSNDNTVEIAKKYNCKIISLPRPRFYTPPGNNRNIGAQKAKGAIFLHIDADMEFPDAMFLDRLLALFDAEHQAINIYEKDVAVGFWNKCKALERLCYWDSDMQGARGVTSSLFSKVGGYDTTISSGEDFYINNLYKKYTKIAASRNLFLYHHTGYISLRKLLTKKYNYGKTSRLYLSRVQQEGSNEYLRIMIVSIQSYIRNIRYLFSDPLHFIGIFILRFLEFVALNLGIMKEALSHKK